MITGAHTIIYSRNPEADRAFLRDVIGLPFVDVGDGWLIFARPPAEVAVHPAEQNEEHELFLICDDIETFAAAMQAKEVSCTPITDQTWGRLVYVTLPGGGKLGVYQAKHRRQ